MIAVPDILHMLELFKKYITTQSPIDVEQIQYIYSFSNEKKVNKNEFVLHEGEISPTHFVTKGLLCLSRINDLGNDHILKFAPENRWISDRESYLKNSPAALNIRAVEDSSMLTWKKTDFDHLLNELPLFRQLMKQLSAKNQIANQTRLYKSISLSAEDKYLDIIINQPGLHNRVPLHMIASYLGLSRETLSRVRKGLAKDKKQYH